MLLIAFIVIGIMFNVVYKRPGGDVHSPITFENIRYSFERVTASIDEYRYDLRYFEILFFVLGSYFNQSTSMGIAFSDDVLFYDEFDGYGFYLFYDDIQTIGPDAKLISCDTANLGLARDRRSTLVHGFTAAVAISNWNIYNKWQLLEDVLGVLKLMAFLSASAVVALGGIVQLAWDQVVVVFDLLMIPFRLTGFIRGF